MDYLLVLDVGTSSLKAAIFDKHFAPVARERAEYAYEADGLKVQIDVEKIWDVLLKVMKKFEEQGYLKKVDLLVPCVFSPALIAMDKEGNSLYPAIIHWDRRSVRQARKALSIVGKETFLNVAGNIPYPGGISLTSLLWLKEKEQKVFQKAFRFGHLNTFLLKRLTNQWSIDPTNASITGLYDTVGGSGWCASIARELGIPLEKLPPVFSCLEMVGSITKDVSRVTGLRAGVPVVMGSNDTSSAALGAGLLRGGQMLNISGSSEILTICLDTPLPHEKYYLRTHPFPGKWLMFDIIIGGFALDWFYAQFCRETNKEEFYSSYLEMVLDGRRGRVRCVPYLTGDRTDLRQRTASFLGLTLSTTREDCLYALIEAVVGRMERTLAMMRERLPLSETMFLTGGGVRALLEYKRRVFGGLTIEVKEDCSVQGCVEMAKQVLGG